MRVKLKYYMRGLGIGIILSTLILSIGDRKEKLSDQEIISRATELGMVMAENDSSSIDELLEGINMTEGAPEPSSIPSIQPSIEPTKAAEEPSAAPTVQPEPTTKPVLTTPKPTETLAEEMKDTEQTDDAEKITFTIKRGMSSRMVAALLEKVGLIDQADEFNEYIEKVNKASVIRTGDYSIKKGASYDEIIEIITTRPE